MAAGRRSRARGPGSQCLAAPRGCVGSGPPAEHHLAWCLRACACVAAPLTRGGVRGGRVCSRRSRGFTWGGRPSGRATGTRRPWCRARRWWPSPGASCCAPCGSQRPGWRVGTRGRGRAWEEGQGGAAPSKLKGPGRPVARSRAITCTMRRIWASNSDQRVLAWLLEERGARAERVLRRAPGWRRRPTCPCPGRRHRGRKGRRPPPRRDVAPCWRRS